MEKTLKIIEDNINKLLKESNDSIRKELLDELNAVKSKLKAIEKKHEQFTKEIFDSNYIPAQLMKKICGGEFPIDPDGFHFEECSHWKVEGDRIVPYDGELPAPGPDFKISMIPYLK